MEILARRYLRLVFQRIFEAPSSSRLGHPFHGYSWVPASLRDSGMLVDSCFQKATLKSVLLICIPLGYSKTLFFVVLLPGRVSAVTGAIRLRTDST